MQQPYTVVCNVFETIMSVSRLSTTACASHVNDTWQCMCMGTLVSLVVDELCNQHYNNNNNN